MHERVKLKWMIRSGQHLGSQPDVVIGLLPTVWNYWILVFFVLLQKKLCPFIYCLVCSASFLSMFLVFSWAIF